MSRAVRDFYERSWQGKLGSSAPAPVDLCRDAAIAQLRLGEQRLLDVGCGPGGLLGAVAARCRFRVGFEVAAAAATVARAHASAVVQGDVDEAGLPFADESFGSVTCIEVIEHVFAPRALVAEIRRVLAVGGELILTTPNIRHWRHLLSIARGRFPRTSTDGDGHDGGHIHYFTSRDVCDLLESVGDWRIEQHGVFGWRSPRSRAVTAVLGRRFAREWLAPGVLLRAVKVGSP